MDITERNLLTCRKWAEPYSVVYCLDKILVLLITSTAVYTVEQMEKNKDFLSKENCMISSIDAQLLPDAENSHEILSRSVCNCWCWRWSSGSGPPSQTWPEANRWIKLLLPITDANSTPIPTHTVHCAIADLPDCGPSSGALPDYQYAEITDWNVDNL